MAPRHGGPSHRSYAHRSSGAARYRFVFLKGALPGAPPNPGLCSRRSCQRRIPRRFPHVTASHEERCVVLDAMGVIYRDGDDVHDLLVPYLRAKGCHLDESRVRALYLACSLGQISSGDFWRLAGVGRLASDEEYCEGYRLNDRVTDLLRELQTRGIRTACLSNDVSEWSRLLRKRFGLESLIPTWVISGDVGIRKPAPEIYQVLLHKLGCDGSAVVLVDDSVRNLDAATTLGMDTILFTPVRFGECNHAQVSSMEQLSEVLLRSAS